MELSSLGGLVSVVTPAYNCKSVIVRCIESVNNQSVPVLEHIIVDDGSMDGTREILREMCKKYKHLVIIEQENQGAGIARNRAISVARGKYIAFLDADDLWLDKKLEAQIGYMEYQGVDFTYGDYKRRCISSASEIADFIPPEQLSYKQLLIGCPIGCLTAAYNQNRLGKVYMSEVRQGQDWSLWLKITRSGVVAHKYKGILAVYNIDESSLSSNKKKKLLNMYKIYREQPFNPILSLVYLILHSLNVLVKKKR